MTKIMVNGCRFEVSKEFLTYDDVALLAGKPDDQSLTITFTTPVVEHRGFSGTLRPGRAIDVQDFMVFDAVKTNSA